MTQWKPLPYPLSTAMKPMWRWNKRDRLRFFRAHGVPFQLRVLFAKWWGKGVPTIDVVDALHKRGIPATLCGWDSCWYCGPHRKYLAVRYKNVRVTFPVTCTGVDWTSPRVRKVARRGGTG